MTVREVAQLLDTLKSKKDVDAYMSNTFDSLLEDDKHKVATMSLRVFRIAKWFSENETFLEYVRLPSTREFYTTGYRYKSIKDEIDQLQEN